MNNFKFISFNGKIFLFSGIAAQNGYKDVVEFLLSKGVDIHHKDNNGWSAIMIGIYKLDEQFLIYFI